MAVRIGSAHIDENGNARGGQAGDQTGKEISPQKWYKHDLGWIVIRAKDNTVREKIAEAMEAACANDRIGYDQGQRETLHAAASKVGFDISKVSTLCETDCSALVRVCCAYAGIKTDSFRTTNQKDVLLKTGAFAATTSSRYTDSPDYLLRGDILVTRKQGHTVVVLDNGPKATVPKQDDPEEPEEKPKVKKVPMKILHPCTLHDTPPIGDGEKELPVGTKVTVWGASMINPEYLAVQLDDGRKGYIHIDAVDGEY